MNDTVFPSCFHVQNTFDAIPYIRDYITFSVVYNALFGLLATVGNLVILITIKKTTSLHVPSYCILSSLAMSDLFVGALVLPMYAIARHFQLELSQPELLRNGESYFKAYCILMLLADGLATLLGCVSGAHLAVISIERYLAISLHLRYSSVVTNRQVIKAVLVVWGFGFLLAVSPYFRQHPDRVVLISVVVLVYYFATLVVLIYCNVKTTLILRRHTRAIISLHHQANAPSNVYVTKFRRSVASLFYVIGLFVICYVPFFISFLVKFLGNSNLVDKLRVFHVTLPFVFLNSALNPWLYLWRYKDIRAGTLNLLGMNGRMGNENRREREPNIVAPAEPSGAVLHDGTVT